MKNGLPFLQTIAALLAMLFIQPLAAQNSSPYWSLAGNSNASATSSKLGTTNSIPLRLYTKNTERMRLDTLGRVGIGTTNPTERLHVNSASGANALRVQVGGSTKLLVHYDGGLSIGNGSQPPANGLYVAGNVGLGTTTPSQKLHVVGNQTLAGNLYFTSGSQSIQFANPGASSNPMIFMFTSGTANPNRMVIGHSPSFPTWGLQYNDNIDQFDFLGAGASKLAINLGSGNVGIGTAAPQFILDVNGRIRLRSGGTASNTAGLWLNTIDNSNLQGFMGIVDNNNMGFYGTGIGWGLVMNTANGNVGIGTFTPQYKLSVNGTIQAKELRVETGWADYVFDNNYRLRSLKEVEDFIKINKHLPGIPSAQEIQNNGLAIGEMQTKMMEKIEELTLYILELQKQISQLQKLQHANK